MNKTPTWLLKSNLSKSELNIVRQLRSIPPAVRDDFERMLTSFLDEEDRIAEFCAYHESLLEGQCYMMDCAYDRDIAHYYALSSVA